MKQKQVKITAILLLFAVSIFAQKFDKKFTERFLTNDKVEVEINASNAEIDVTTWNKNEVAIEAIIEVEGLSKDEAKKYLNNWNFEAMGNKNKVEINANGNRFHSFGKDNFVFFNNGRNDFSFVLPEIPEFPEIEFFDDSDILVLPEINFGSDNFILDLDDFDFNQYKKDGGKYFFQWKDDTHDIKIKSKKEWEKFKKTKEYKKLKKNMEAARKKMKKAFNKSREKNDKKLKEMYQREIKKYNAQKEKYAEIAKKALAKVKNKSSFTYSFSSDNESFKINGKEVKITKKIRIKVPKKATFNLNTRHCKVKLPNTIAYGNVKYGTFDANNLNGGKLTIDFSPVNINDLNESTLFLNNVTDAKIASVTNATMHNNSSGVKIVTVNNNVNLSNKFGELLVENFNPNMGEFILNLSYSDAKLFLGNTKSNFKFNVHKVKLDNKRVATISKNAPKSNIIKVNGDYSSIVIK